MPSQQKFYDDDDDDDDDEKLSVLSEKKRKATSLNGQAEVKRNKLKAEGLEKDSKHRAYILRIRMRNFLPYDDTTIRPGPRLNLVVGPNGSGKSTIVSAICLGLAGSLKIMDRGKSASDFIKNGKNSGSIEIELSQPHGKKVTILRKMKKNEKKSEWFMNGEPTQEKQVAEFVKEQNIKLDNLCHFLPQEKVVEFAKLADRPQEMLIKVEEAVGPPHMRDDHEELIKMSEAASLNARSFESKQNQLKELEAKRETLRVAIERYKQVQDLKQLLEIVEKKICYIQLEAVRVEYTKRKNAVKALKDELEVKKRQYEEKRSELSLLKQNMKKARQNSSEHDKKLRNRQLEIESLLTTIIDLERDSKNLERSIRGKEKEKEMQEEKIRRLEKELNELKDKRLLKREKPANLDEELKENQEKYSKAMRTLKGTEAAGETLKAEREKCRSEVQQKEAELKNHLSVFERKTRSLKNSRPDIYRAYEWIRENQDRFSEKVYGPVFLDINVKQKEHADYTEAVLGRDMDSFVVQNRQDREILTTEMNKPNSPLKPITLYTMPPGARTSNFERKTQTLDSKVLQAYHITGSLLDVVDAEQPMLQWLCSEKMFHRILLGDSVTWQKRNELAEGREFRHEDPRTKKFRHLVAGDGLYTPNGSFRVNFSIHGSRNMLFTSSDVRPSNRLIVGDDSENERKNQEIQRCREKLQELNQQVDENQQLEDQARAALNAAGNELKKIKDLVVQFDSKALDNQIKEKEKVMKMEANKKPLQGKDELVARLKKVLQRRKDSCKEVADAVRTCAELHMQQVASVLEAEPLEKKYKQVEQEEGSIKSQYNTLKENYDQEHDEMQKIKQRMDTLRRDMPEISEEDQEAFRNLEEGEEELERKRDKLKEDISKLGIQADRQAEFDMVKSQIEELSGELSNFASAVEEEKKKLERKKKLWLDGGDRGNPNRQVGLREIVEKINECFSDSFQRMGNVGEVKLLEKKNKWNEDDFANYAITIMVKFREEQELLPLDGRVQSGGETSLSTMLFLLSLQQITRCPFRVVDEINQGMDIHYEKAVFEKIVEWSCREDTSQCFLITPKLQGNLLANVRDHISVLCVFKGRDLYTDQEGWVL